jgi:hypothetical protein
MVVALAAQPIVNTAAVVINTILDMVFIDFLLSRRAYVFHPKILILAAFFSGASKVLRLRSRKPFEKALSFGELSD